ncbi:larval cuticle protein A2B-like [Papilio machaon]|uniref:larval cuticle protein A2B-like n=1 Tax=Papilio machaon TaxID=76193 RepID=UPI001E6633B6|nr:larval cuticle protein A2B-like [Papilio machaon]
MAAKLFVILAFVAATQASILATSQDNDYTSFAYDVADPNTGDYKSQVESRIGGTVKGQYSLIDPDGTKRIVDYTADDINGFNAVVRKEPIVTQAVVPVSPAIIPAVKSVVSTPLRSISSPAVYSVGSPRYYTASPSVYNARSYVAPYYYPRSTTYNSYAAPLNYYY